MGTAVAPTTAMLIKARRESCDKPESIDARPGFMIREDVAMEREAR
jgi:hypothetical protein